MDQAYGIFCENRYPDKPTERYKTEVSPKFRQYTMPKKKMSIILSLISDEVSELFPERLTTAAQKTFNVSEIKVFNLAHFMVVQILNDRLQLWTTLMWVYEFTCYRESGYIGRASRRLIKSIQGEYPTWLIKRDNKDD